MSIIKRILAWIVSLFRNPKQLFCLVWNGEKNTVKDALTEAVNDPDLQQLALAAVAEAARCKLSGDEAWDKAFGILTGAMEKRGMALGRSILDTALQIAYAWFKAHGGLGGLDGVQD